MKVIVLGAGLVGGPIAVDLAQDAEMDVTVTDINASRLEKLQPWAKIKTMGQDLSDPGTVTRLVQDYDFVVSAVPGFLGFQTLKAVIEAEKSVVDIAFFPEDPFQLDDLAKAHNVVAIMDCGVAPGMSNILIGYIDHELDEAESALIYVGGLPEIREWPYDYKAVFSPIDVIEEYTRPARYVEHGKLVVRPALSDAELLNFPGIGTLEAFNSDGLRTLTQTLHIPTMKEKTLRYPGHIEKIAVLRETGFFSQQPIEIHGVHIRPVDFTAKLLFPKWELQAGERDLTVMEIVVDGKKDGKRLRYRYDLLDYYDEKTHTHSMARTTGYTATVALRMIASGKYRRTGISAPEFIGQQPECVDYMIQGLKDRGIIYRQTIEPLD